MYALHKYMKCLIGICKRNQTCIDLASPRLVKTAITNEVYLQETLKKLIGIYKCINRGLWYGVNDLRKVFQYFQCFWLLMLKH